MTRRAGIALSVTLAAVLLYWLYRGMNSAKDPELSSTSSTPPARAAFSETSAPSVDYDRLGRDLRRIDKPKRRWRIEVGFAQEGQTLIATTKGTRFSVGVWNCTFTSVDLDDAIDRRESQVSGNDPSSTELSGFETLQCTAPGGVFIRPNVPFCTTYGDRGEATEVQLGQPGRTRDGVPLRMDSLRVVCDPID